MKTFLYTTFAILVLFSCNSEKTENNSANKPSEKENTEKKEVPTKENEPKKEIVWANYTYPFNQAIESATENKEEHSMGDCTTTKTSYDINTDKVINHKVDCNGHGITTNNFHLKDGKIIANHSITIENLQHPEKLLFKLKEEVFIPKDNDMFEHYSREIETEDLFATPKLLDDNNLKFALDNSKSLIKYSEIDKKLTSINN